MLALAVLLLLANDNPEGAFQHKRHASLKLPCAFCHNGTAERARFPAVDKCRVCHTAITDRKIPSQRVYRLPDFIIFSHARHQAAACSTCHGEVNQAESLKIERSLKMPSCVACHKQRQATQVCTACHELGQ